MARERTLTQDVLAQTPQVLQAVRDEIARLRAQERLLAADLHLAGMDWAGIGRLLGITRQAARQRYGPEVETWRAIAGDTLPWDAFPEVYAQAFAGTPDDLGDAAESVREAVLDVLEPWDVAR